LLLVASEEGTAERLAPDARCASKLYPQILSTCKRINREGSGILYRENSTKLTVDISLWNPRDEVLAIHVGFEPRYRGSALDKFPFAPTADMSKWQLAHDTIMKWYEEAPLISCVGTVNFDITLNILFLNDCEEWSSIMSRWLGNFFESQFMRNRQLHKIRVIFCLDRITKKGWPTYSRYMGDTLRNLLKSIPKRESLEVDLDPLLAAITI
jgi:hypothetical protein